MQCHLGPKTLNLPGLLVRSVYTASNGTPVANVDGFVNGHNSPLKERWGGWYVTGTVADSSVASLDGPFRGAGHLGNLFVTNPSHPEALELSEDPSVMDLRERF